MSTGVDAVVWGGARGLLEVWRRWMLRRWADGVCLELERRSTMLRGSRMVGWRACCVVMVAETLAVFVADGAAAEDQSGGEMAAGAQWLVDGSGGSGRRGWFVSGGPYVGDRFGIVMEMARRVVSDPRLGVGVGVEEATYMGGGVVRHGFGAVSGFGQVMFGGMFRRLAGGGGRESVGLLTAGRIVQTGGGVDIGTRGRTSARVAVMHLRVLGDARRRNGVKVMVGAVYRFGARE